MDGYSSTKSTRCKECHQPIQDDSYLHDGICPVCKGFSKKIETVEDTVEFQSIRKGTEESIEEFSIEVAEEAPSSPCGRKQKSLWGKLFLVLFLSGCGLLVVGLLVYKSLANDNTDFIINRERKQSDWSVKIAFEKDEVRSKYNHIVIKPSEYIQYGDNSSDWAYKTVSDIQVNRRAGPLRRTIRLITKDKDTIEHKLVFHWEDGYSDMGGVTVISGGYRCRASRSKACREIMNNLSKAKSLESGKRKANLSRYNLYVWLGNRWFKKEKRS